MRNEAPNENVRSLLWANNRRDRAALPKERQTLSIMCVLARTKWWTVGAAVRFAPVPLPVRAPARACARRSQRLAPRLVRRRPFAFRYPPESVAQASTQAVSRRFRDFSPAQPARRALGRRPRQSASALEMHYEDENYSALTRQCANASSAWSPTSVVPSRFHGAPSFPLGLCSVGVRSRPFARHFAFR
jgi:hypothetical protein